MLTALIVIPVAALELARTTVAETVAVATTD
jgi:hypothetical protein